MKKRVVVTGIGIISSIGLNKTDFWNNLVNGRSGISEIESFDASKFPIKKGGEIKNFSLADYTKKINPENFGRASQFAIAATIMAIKDANIDSKKIAKAGTIIGTTLADAPLLEQIDKHWLSDGENDVLRSNIRRYPGYNLSNNISFLNKFTNANYVIPTACAAGNYSIGFSYDLIRQGKSNIMVAGGADPIARTNLTGFNRLIAMAPEKCQPFDKNRKGMIIGEGAGVLVLEDYESAKKRNANIYAEILGYGLSCDATSMTLPSTDGIRKVMEKAIKNSGIHKEDIDYISAHGTGTPANDKAECTAINQLFGDRKVPVSSIKSILGHTMGAASAIEAITCCLVINNNIIPPTINHETSDPECRVNCVPNKSIKTEVKIALNNSFAFGGNNACVVFKKYEE